MSRGPRTRAERKSPAERSIELSAAARDLALAEGLHAVTLRAVAARAEVTPGLVAHYASSMDELVAATFSDIVSAELDEIGALIAEGSATERLAVLVRTLLDATRDDVTLVWVDAWSMGRRSDALAGAVRAQMDRWQLLIRDLVAEGIADGSMRVDEPADAAWQLLGMIDGLNAQALVRWGGASDRSALLERAVEGLLGIAPGALERVRLQPSGRTP